MNIEDYNQIYNYLNKQQIPTELNSKEKQRFINRIKNYEIKNRQLYRQKENRSLKVIKRYELEPLFKMIHDDSTAGHFATEIMYQKIKERYYWPKLYDDIKTYVKSCDQCQRRKKPTNKHELHIIIPKEPFELIGIDFIGPLPITERNNRYIITATDYFTKWSEAKAVEKDNADEVITFIYDELICRHGNIKRILSDRGTHFNNQKVNQLLNKFNIKHILSTPYHPKTNGQVERFNSTLCESLSKLSDERKNWDLYISPTLFAYRTSKNSTTKIEPFFLTYGRNAKLLIDQNSNETITLNQRINSLIEKLPNERYRAKKQIIKTQQKRKESFDKKIKTNQKFEIGDKVLYYNAAKEKQWSGKLEEKWKGPYYIHEVKLNGSYTLKNTDNQIIEVPVNGELLKLYHDRQNFIPYVVI